MSVFQNQDEDAILFGGTGVDVPEASKTATSYPAANIAVFDTAPETNTYTGAGTGQIVIPFRGYRHFFNIMSVADSASALIDFSVTAVQRIVRAQAPFTRDERVLSEGTSNPHFWIGRTICEGSWNSSGATLDPSYASDWWPSGKVGASTATCTVAGSGASYSSLSDDETFYIDTDDSTNNRIINLANVPRCDYLLFDLFARSGGADVSGALISGQRLVW